MKYRLVRYNGKNPRIITDIKETHDWSLAMFEYGWWMRFHPNDPIAWEYITD